jgi:hypothetical protein
VNEATAVKTFMSAPHAAIEEARLLNGSEFTTIQITPGAEHIIRSPQCCRTRTERDGCPVDHADTLLSPDFLSVSVPL